MRTVGGTGLQPEAAAAARAAAAGGPGTELASSHESRSAAGFGS